MREIKIILVGTLIAFYSTITLAKGPLDIDIAVFSKNTLIPMLVKSGLCTSRQDCRQKEIFFCTSWHTISCDFYGITSEVLIDQILAEMKSQKLKIGSVTFWRKTYQDKSFLDIPVRRFHPKVSQ